MLSPGTEKPLVHPLLRRGLGSIYGFLQGAWPFGVVEAVWTLVALRRWQRLEPGRASK